MQPIVLLRAWSDVAGWAAVLARSSGIARRLALKERPTLPREKTREPATRLKPGREWEMVMGLAARELSRVPAIAAIQARAAMKIDAAEHAYNRIIADCAKVLRASVTPTFQPARQLTRQPEPPERQPLAA